MQSHQLLSRAGAVPGFWQTSDTTLGQHERRTHPSLGLTAPSTMSSFWGGLESQCGSPLMRPSGKQGVGGVSTVLWLERRGWESGLCLNVWVTAVTVFSGDC